MMTNTLIMMSLVALIQLSTASDDDYYYDQVWTKFGNELTEQTGAVLSKYEKEKKMHPAGNIKKCAYCAWPFKGYVLKIHEEKWKDGDRQRLLKNHVQDHLETCSEYTNKRNRTYEDLVPKINHPLWKDLDAKEVLKARNRALAKANVYWWTEGKYDAQEKLLRKLTETDKNRVLCGQNRFCRGCGGHTDDAIKLLRH